MDDKFEIPVSYKGEDLLLNASVKAFGYTPRIEVEINGSTILFEQDEEGKYRAVVLTEDANKNYDLELLALVTEVLDAVRE